MGIESFYINVVEQNAFFSTSSDNLTYSGSKSKNIKETEKFIRNSKKITSLLEINMFEDQGYIQGFSLQGCFSCYESAVKQIIDFIVFTDANFMKLKICLSKNSFCEVTEIKKIKEYFDKKFLEKRMSFNKDYDVSFLSKPGNFFYRKYFYYKLLRKS